MDATNLIDITDLSNAELDALLGMDDEETIEDLRAAADPEQNITNDVIRAYGRVKPSEAGTVAAALAGDRGSRAEIAMDLGYKTFVLRTWML